MTGKATREHTGRKGEQYNSDHLHVSLVLRPVRSTCQQRRSVDLAEIRFCRNHERAEHLTSCELHKRHSFANTTGREAPSFSPAHPRLSTVRQHGNTFAQLRNQPSSCAESRKSKSRTSVSSSHKEVSMAFACQRVHIEKEKEMNERALDSFEFCISRWKRGTCRQEHTS